MAETFFPDHARVLWALRYNKTQILVIVGMCFLLLNACSVGREHTSDSKLEQNFFRHELEFEALRVDVQSDEKLLMIGVHQLNYAGRGLSSDTDFPEIERLGLTKERWSGYQRQLRDLGLVQINKGEDGSVEFRVDPGSFFNGDSHKGYEYNSKPEHPKASLDSYRISESDSDASGGYYVSKLLKGRWRLYLYVNG